MIINSKTFMWITTWDKFFVNHQIGNLSSFNCRALIIRMEMAHFVRPAMNNSLSKRLAFGYIRHPSLVYQSQTMCSIIVLLIFCALYPLLSVSHFYVSIFNILCYEKRVLVQKFRSYFIKNILHSTSHKINKFLDDI